MEIITVFTTSILLALIKYFVIAGIPFLIFYKWDNIQKFVASKIQKRKASSKDFIREILYSIQSSFIFLAITVLLLKTDLKYFTKYYEDIHDYPLWWIPISLLLVLVIHDTYFYWMHRLIHTPFLFKKIHLVHHQSVNPSPWASKSFHFLEACMEILILPIILFLLPLHEITIGTFAILLFGINVYGHLGFEIMPQSFRKSFLFEIVNTSVHHNLHHSKFKGNFGLYFRLWDRWMKTENPNYVKEYDKLQEQRFGSLTNNSLQTNSKRTNSTQLN